MRALLLTGAGAIAAGLQVPSLYLGSIKLSLIGPTLLALGSLSLGLCSSMLAYSLWGKFKVRDRMLSSVPWKGGETVLDVGTGLGLLAVGAAKRLPGGMVVGIDIWRRSDLSSNRLENCQRNAELEGVQDRVELRGDDARDISFVDNSFDAVLSLCCICNIPDPEGRALACREIVRVLKRDGIAIVADSAYTDEYARIFKEAGLKVEGPKSYLFAYAPIALVTARKL